jgi:hypothetical protein
MMGTAIEVEASGLVKKVGRHQSLTMFIIYLSGHCVFFLFRMVVTQTIYAACHVTKLPGQNCLTIIFYLFSSSLCRSVLD